MIVGRQSAAPFRLWKEGRADRPVTIRRKKAGKKSKAPTPIPSAIPLARRLYVPRAQQQELHDALKRFNVLVAHRRFGKGALYH